VPYVDAQGSPSSADLSRPRQMCFSVITPRRILVCRKLAIVTSYAASLWNGSLCLTQRARCYAPGLMKASHVALLTGRLVAGPDGEDEGWVDRELVEEAIVCMACSCRGPM